MTDVAEAEPKVTEGLARNGSSTVRVQTKTDDFTFDCEAGDTILAAGLAAGYTLPYECSTGTCGTCHARVMEGEVDPGWADAPGYAKLKRDKGDILMCQARPDGPCFVRVKTNAKQPERPAPVALRQNVKIENVRRLTRDVIEFEAVLARPMTYRAGQFVTLRHGSIDGARAYSMVNFGKAAERLTFVVKRKPGGRFSDLIFDGDLGGEAFEIVGPLGRATFRPEEDRDFLCIAGGSGIAGMMAMLRHATDVGYFDAHHRGHVFFGVRTLEDAFYLEHFAEHLAAADAALDVTIAVSDETDVASDHPDFPRIRIASGMVHEVATAAMGDKWKNATAFVAGPQPMVDAAIGVLIKSGLDPQNIRFDKFS